MAQCTLGRAFPTSKNLDSKDTWTLFHCIHLRFSIAKNSRPCHYLSLLWSTSSRTLSECIYRFPASSGWRLGANQVACCYSSRSQLQDCHFCRSGPWGQNIWRRFSSSCQKVLHQSTATVSTHSRPGLDGAVGSLQRDNRYHCSVLPPSQLPWHFAWCLNIKLAKNRTKSANYHYSKLLQMDLLSHKKNLYFVT